MYVDINTGLVSDTYNSSKQDEKKIIRDMKNYLINNGKYDIYKNQIFAYNSQYLSQTYGTDLNKKYECYLGAELNLSKFEEKCCRQIFDAKRSRVRRLKNKLQNMLSNGTCLFLTLTFRDDVLNSTLPYVRRKYIQRWLSSLNVVDYVANIDFGDKEKNPLSKEREHYHAIVCADRIDLSSYPYGIINCEVIRVSASSHKSLAKYLNKLSNHTYKDSTKNCCRLIYKRSSYGKL